MALAAELSRLVAAGSTAGRIVGGANKEHGRVVARRQTGIRGGDVDYVHEVLVVAAGACHDGSVVVGGQVARRSRSS